MGSKPIILILYANSSEEVYLNKLPDEGKEIQRILNTASNREYEVRLIPDAGVQNIIDELQPGREIEIVHYAGHSNAQKMLLEDNSVQALDFASKLKGHKSLKLVFINGCSSYGQVRFFHEAGIPYVIATSRPVEDEKASWVAARFYWYLTVNCSVSEAFSEVEKDSRLLKKEIEFSDVRGIESIENESDDTELIWGLYALENADEYRLALRVSQQNTQERVDHSIFLQNMIRSLKNYKSPINESYLDTIKNGVGNVPDKTIVKDLLSILPYPLGIRLQQINGNALSPDNSNSSDYYRELLYDYTFFFETLLHYTTSIILCQIWQENPQLAAEHGDIYTLIRTFVSTNRLSQPFETYGSVINAGLELVQELGESVSKEGLKITNYLNSTDFRLACTFFDSHKEYYWNKIRLPQEFAIQQCYDAQKHLTTGFAAFGFVIEKKLTSVRDIDVINFRHAPKEFRNSIVQLVIADVEATRLQSENFPMENKSILYFSDSSFKKKSKSLNLFPFLLDRNVFTQQAATEVDLYLFIGFCKDPMLNDISIKKLPYPCYYFVSLKNPGKIWRFDDDEQNSDSADLAHIDEQTEEQHRQNHLLTNADDLKKYLAEFKKFFQNV